MGDGSLPATTDWRKNTLRLQQLTRRTAFGLQSAVAFRLQSSNLLSDLDGTEDGGIKSLLLLLQRAFLLAKTVPASETPVASDRAVSHGAELTPAARG